MSEAKVPGQDTTHTGENQAEKPTPDLSGLSETTNRFLLCKPKPHSPSSSPPIVPNLEHSAFVNLCLPSHCYHSRQAQTPSHPGLSQLLEQPLRLTPGHSLPSSKNDVLN